MLIFGVSALLFACKQAPKADSATTTTDSTAVVVDSTAVDSTVTK